MVLSLLRRYEGWFSFAFVLALIVAAFTGFQAFFGYDALPPATPVPVAQSSQPTLANAPTATLTAPPATAFPTATPTPLPSATATMPPTAAPSYTPTDTPVPTPLPTALPPTDTPVPLVNQPPQVQAELVPIDIDDDREAGLFQIQVAATDPEGALQHVLIILKLPPSERERKVKDKTDEKTEIKFTNKQLEIKAPDPQVILDQINAYGGIIVQNGQQIDLRRKDKGEGKITWREERWRVEAQVVDLEVIATDSLGDSSTIYVQSCLSKDCLPEEDE